MVPLATIAQDLSEGVAEAPRRVAISFDDAYRSVLAPVRDAMQDAPFSATAFIIPGLLGGMARWLGGVPPEEQDLFTWSDVDTWCSWGLDLGSHSMTHRDLTRLDALELERDLDVSLKVVRIMTEGLVGLSYPWGIFGDREVDTARSVGYDFAVTTRAGTRHLAEDRFRLRRIMIERDDEPGDLDLKIRGGYDWTGASLLLPIIRR